MWEPRQNYMEGKQYGNTKKGGMLLKVQEDFTEVVILEIDIKIQEGKRKKHEDTV